MKTNPDRLTLPTGAILVIVAVAMTGCAGQGGSITHPRGVLPPDGGSAAYIDRISSLSAVSENNAFRGILLLLDGKDNCADFSQRIRKLRDRGIASQNWHFSARRPLTKGKLAYMLYHGCKLPGGVTLTLTGASQRYCLLELQHQGFMSSGMPHTHVTGLEFVAAITRADTYLETGDLPGLISSTGQ